MEGGDGHYVQTEVEFEVVDLVVERRFWRPDDHGGSQNRASRATRSPPLPHDDAATKVLRAARLAASCRRPAWTVLCNLPGCGHVSSLLEGTASR
jgi:hypothetical protein